MFWDFVTDVAFYAFLGLLLFVPLTYLVAAFTATDVREARARVKAFLSNWIAGAEADAIGKVMGFAGVSAFCLLLGIGAYAANRLGDAVVPVTSWMTWHDAARWSLEARQEWWELGWNYRTEAGIGGDEAAWERSKAGMGRYDVRFFRTSLVLFGVIAVAGAADLLRRHRGRPGDAMPSLATLRKRGLSLMLAGAFGAVASQVLWAERQDQFVRNLSARYDDVYWSRYCELPLVAQSYPYQRSMVQKSSVERRRPACLSSRVLAAQQPPPP
jgi:hypothetical protein